jgi:hypothetical protein
MQFNEAAGRLASLQYTVHDLQKLLEIGKSVDNLKKTTLDKIRLPKQYDSSNNNLVKLEELKVDIAYQRKMRLKKLVDKLKKEGGFNKETAGHIDIAVRPDGTKFIWDGFRRAFMAGLVGLEQIPASIYYHPANRTIKQCREYEAKMFKTRNAETESMKAEEIFRSEIMYKDTAALNFLDFLVECKLDVEELNPGNKTLGGFVQLQNVWKNNHISHDNLIVASDIIQSTWPSDPTVSGYLLCGLGKFLDINDEIDYSIDSETIQECFHEYVNVNPPKKQDSLTGRRLNKSPNTSIAYYIALYVIGMDDETLGQFVPLLGMDNDELEMVEED